jgi:predicted nucleic acid-binding protein
MVVIDASVLVDALQALATANRLGLRRHPSAPSGPSLGAAHQPLRHDALTVALAEQLDVPLLTADARLARAPGLRCVVELAET